MSKKKPPSAPVNDECFYPILENFPLCVDGPSTHAEYKVIVRKPKVLKFERSKK